MATLDRILAAITAERKKLLVPRLDGLLSWNRYGSNRGWYYVPKNALEHGRGRIDSYLSRKCPDPSSLRARVARAFKLICYFEGGFASIQTYDNMGFTFGPGLAYGWGRLLGEGVPCLGRMLRDTRSPLAQLFIRNGVYVDYDEKARRGLISVVNGEKGSVVSGPDTSLEMSQAIIHLRGYRSSEAAILDRGTPQEVNPPRPSSAQEVLIRLFIEAATSAGTEAAWADGCIEHLHWVFTRPGIDRDYAGLARIHTKLKSDALFGWLAHINWWGCGFAGDPRGGVLPKAMAAYQAANGAITTPTFETDRAFARWFLTFCRSDQYKAAAGYVAKVDALPDEWAKFKQHFEQESGLKL